MWMDKGGLLAVFTVLLCCYHIYGCQCAFGKPKQKYCQADWVARTQIVDFKEINVTNLNDALLQTKNVEYKVKYVQIFKSPEEMNNTLPTTVYTPAVDALCGIFLDKGKEYLLSGRFYNGSSVTTLCSQILFDDKHKSMENDILLWHEVPKELADNLAKKALEPCK